MSDYYYVGTENWKKRALAAEAQVADLSACEWADDLPPLSKFCGEDHRPVMDIRERRAGKTTDLIRWASEEQPPPAPMRYIVCQSQRECSRVLHAAQEMELTIAMPVTWEEMTRMRGLPRPCEFAVDELAVILSRMVPWVLSRVVW